MLNRHLKAGIVILSATGLLSLVLGGMVWVFISRASIRVEKREQWIQSEIARLRDRYSQLVALEWQPYQAVLAHIAEGKFEGVVFQGSHIGPSQIRNITRWRSVGFPFETTSFAEDVGFPNRHRKIVSLLGPSTLAQSLLETVLAQDALRGGGLEVAFIRASWENQLFHGWQALIANSQLTPEDLAECGGVLDRLATARPTLREEFDVEHVLRNIALVRELRSPSVSNSRFLAQVGWRSLYSRTIRCVQLFDALDQLHLKEVAFEALPYDLWTRISPGMPIGGTFDPEIPLEIQGLASALYAYEAEAALRRTMLRVVVGIAWYQAEHNMFPVGLNDLVPRYVAQIPLCPLTRKAFSYHNGVLSSDWEDTVNRWVIAPLK